MIFRAIAIGAILVAATNVRANAQGFGPRDTTTMPPTDVERVAVGAPAPDFRLVRYGGGSVTLSELRGRKNVVLVFFRGYWCPYCIEQLRNLRTLLDAELKATTELLVVSIDGDNENRQTVARIARDGVQPDFSFLTDSASRVISRYGLLNPASGSRGGIPHPATYVIDRQGVVRWKRVDLDYRIRPDNAEVLAALKAIGG